MMGRDLAIVFATLIGPVLAVQVQKWLEFYREKRNRKIMVFSQLMATRAARLSPEHVRALNMIDLVFYGGTSFGRRRRTRQEQRVLDAWKEYLDKLGSQVPEEGQQQFWESRDELFINLLVSIAQDVGYAFDRVHLKRNVYSPVAHEVLEQEQRALRQAALGTLSGANPLKLEVVSLPTDPEAFAAYKATVERLRDALEGGTLRVASTNGTSWSGST